MKKTTKAILASAFVFPGVGQLLLKRHFLAITFISSALCATAIILHYVINAAIAVSGRIISGEVEPDIFLIRQLIIEQQASSNIFLVNIATWCLIAIWLISIIDAYLAGKAQKNSSFDKEINT